jgi:Tol biopolymer transport system component
LTRTSTLVRLVLTAAVLGLLPVPEAAGFGKNKIAYDQMAWRVYSSEHFDFHYYIEAELLIGPVVEEFEDAYSYLRGLFGVDLKERIPVILYMNGRHFQQTNVLPYFIPENVAGFHDTSKLRLVIPIHQTRAERKRLILHELTHSFQFTLLAGSRFGAVFLRTPLWLIEGLAEYASDARTPLGDAVFRDAVVHNAVPPLSDLQHFNALADPYLGYRIGHEAVTYLVETYGWPKFMSFLRELRLTTLSGNVKKACRETYDLPLKKLSKQFLGTVEVSCWDFYRQTEDPMLHYGPEVVRNKSELGNLAPAWSPGGDLVAYFSGKKGRADIFLGPVEPPAEDEGVRDLLRLTRRFSKHDYLSPIISGRPLAWSPDGSALAFFVREHRHRVLYVVDVFTGRLLRSFVVPLETATSPTWSPTGDAIAFSAYQGGQCDLFALTLADGELHRLTNDPEIDVEPDWSPDGQSILYSAELTEGFRLRRVRLEGGLGGALAPETMSAGPGDDGEPCWLPDGERVVFVGSGKDLVNNLYLLDLGSGERRQLTNVFTSVGHPTVSPDGNWVMFQALHDLSFRIFRVRLAELLERSREREALGGRRDLAEDPWTQHRATLEGKPPLSAEETLPLEAVEGNPLDKDYPLFSTPLEGKRLKFRLQADESFDAGGAIRSDGLFLGYVAASFSDILGNHRFLVGGASVGNVQSYYLGYLYLKRRWDLFLESYRNADYVYINGRREFFHETAGSATFIWPFNTFFRSESYVFGGRRNYDVEIYPYVRPKYDFFGVGQRLVGDTVLYSFLGAEKGQRFVVGYEHGFEGLGDFDYSRVILDYRLYVPLFRYTVLAARSAAYLTWGDKRLMGSIGGADTIRGYDYGELIGTHLAWTSLEYRFPVGYAVLLPLGGFGIVGRVFFDAGTAWFEDEEIRLVEKRDGRYELLDVKASVGIGFTMYLGGIVWNFDWAKRTNFRDISADSYFELSIGASF